MSEKRPATNIVVAAILGAAAIVCTVLVTRAAIRIKGGNDIIRVTGSARKAIRSDLIIWTARISYRAPEMRAAYQGLKGGMDRAKAYVTGKGVPEAEILDRPIQTRTLYAPRTKVEEPYPTEDAYRKIQGYELSQELEVRSTKVDLVAGLARKSTELISSGVALESLPPQYIYTKLGELKITMLAQAAKDARTRAEQIAKNTGCQLGEVRFARMGVMRITPAYAVTEVDAVGTNDTTSLDKEITAIVTAGFAIR